MTTLLACLLSAFVSFFVFFYFLLQWQKQRPKNSSTLAWAFGFLVYSLTHALSAYLHSGLYQISPSNLALLQTIRGLFNNLFFVLIFWGTIRLICRRNLTIYATSVFALIFSCVLVLARGQLFSEHLTYIQAMAYAVYLPFSLLFIIVYLILYGMLLAESVKRRSGIILIIVSWVIYAFISVFLPAWYTEHLDYWYTIRAVSTVFLLVGFIVLERETREAINDLENDKKNHRHFK